MPSATHIFIPVKLTDHLWALIRWDTHSVGCFCLANTDASIHRADRDGLQCIDSKTQVDVMNDMLNFDGNKCIFIFQSTDYQKHANVCNYHEYPLENVGQCERCENLFPSLYWRLKCSLCSNPSSINDPQRASTRTDVVNGCSKPTI